MEYHKNCNVHSLDDKIGELERNLSRAIQNLRSKENLVKLQTEQLQKLETMYKHALDENENLNYAHKKTIHDLENMKIILKQYEQKAVTKNAVTSQYSQTKLENTKDDRTDIESIKKMLKDQDSKTSMMLKLFDDKSIKTNCYVIGEYIENLKDISIRLQDTLKSYDKPHTEPQETHAETVCSCSKPREVVMLQEAELDMKPGSKNKSETTTSTMPSTQESDGKTASSESLCLKDTGTSCSYSLRLSSHGGEGESLNAPDSRKVICALRSSFYEIINIPSGGSVSEESDEEVIEVCDCSTQSNNIQPASVETAENGVNTDIGASYMDQISVLQNDNARMVEEMQQMIKYHSSAEDELTSAKGVLMRCRNEIDTKTQEIELLKPKINELKDEINKLGEKMRTNEEKIQEQCVLLEHMNDENDYLRTESAKKQDEIDYLHTESAKKQDEIDKINDAHQKRMLDQDEVIKRLQNDISNMETANNRATSANCELIHTICNNMAENLRTETKNVCEHYANNMDTLRAENENLKQVIVKLQNMNEEYYSNNKHLMEVNEDLNRTALKLSAVNERIEEVSEKLSKEAVELKHSNEMLVKLNKKLRDEKRVCVHFAETSTTITECASKNCQAVPEDLPIEKAETPKDEEPRTPETIDSDLEANMCQLSTLERDLDVLINEFYKFKDFAHGEIKSLLNKNEEINHEYEKLCICMNQYKEMHDEMIAEHAKTEEKCLNAQNDCNRLLTENTQLRNEIITMKQKPTVEQQEYEAVCMKHFEEVKSLTINYEKTLAEARVALEQRNDQVIKCKRLIDEKQEQLGVKDTFIEELSSMNREMTRSLKNHAEEKFALSEELKALKQEINNKVKLESRGTSIDECFCPVCDEVCDTSSIDQVYNDLKTTYEKYKEDSVAIQNLMTEEIDMLKRQLTTATKQLESSEQIILQCNKCNQEYIDKLSNKKLHFTCFENEDEYESKRFIALLQKEISQLRAEGENMINSMSRLEREFEQSKQQYSELQGRHQSLLMDNDSLKKDNELLRSKQMVLDSSKEVPEKLSVSKSEVQSDCDKYKKEIDELQKFISEVCYYQDIYFEMHRRYVDKQKTLEKLSLGQINKDLLNECKDLADKLNDLNEAKAHIEQEFNKYVHENERLKGVTKGEIGRLTAELERLRSLFCGNHQVVCIQEYDYVAKQCEEYKRLLDETSIAVEAQLKEFKDYKKFANDVKNQLLRENAALKEEVSKRRMHFMNACEVDNIVSTSKDMKQRMDRLRSYMNFKEHQVRTLLDHRAQAKKILKSYKSLDSTCTLLSSQSGDSFFQSLLTSNESRLTNKPSKSALPACLTRHKSPAKAAGHVNKRERSKTKTTNSRKRSPAKNKDTVRSSASLNHYTSQPTKVVNTATTSSNRKPSISKSPNQRV